MSCGLFSQYIVHLGCINKYLIDGYIPIVDLKTRKNKYNDRNTSLNNPWELFFDQIFNYTLDEVIKYAKNVKYLICSPGFHRPNEMKIYYDRNTINFWKNIAKKYMPIKKSIIDEVNIIKNKLFGDSQNILGVKLRGTDYKNRPKGHSVQPKIERVIIDVKKADLKYNYDFIFFATEDESIKKQFIPEFKKKIKMLNPDDEFMINFKEINYQHLNYIKNYLFNILILSKCLDIITSRCCGAAGVYLFSSGFRNSIIYLEKFFDIKSRFKELNIQPITEIGNNSIKLPKLSPKGYPL